MDIQHYCSAEGRDVVIEWLRAIDDVRAQGAVLARIARLEAGNFGDCKSVGGGVWELRIHVGPGYRLYYAQIDRLVVLLLGGGEKRGQARDIRVAQIRLADFRSRRSVQ